MLLLALSAPASDPASLRLFATRERVEPGQAFAYVLSYDGPAATVTLALAPELALEGTRATSGTCAASGAVLTCDVPGLTTITANVRVLPQPCGPPRLLVATADAGSAQASTLVRLEPSACPTPTPSPTPTPEPHRVYLPRV